VNLVAPAADTNRDLSKALGRVLRRPAFAPVPELALKLLYGEMAQIVVTGANVQPTQLMKLGYEFRHRELEAALRTALGRW
jgi:NAD dependent epimerase/dehydratase family enzyme